MAKAHTPSFSYEIKLAIGERDTEFLNEVFFHGNCIYNALVAYCREQISTLRGNPEYQEALAAYQKARQSGNPMKECQRILDSLIRSHGLTEYGLHGYVKPLQKEHQEWIHSHVAQKLASACYRAVEKTLYGSGKQIHFRKLMDMHSIENKNNDTGLRFTKGVLLFGKHKFSVSAPRKGTKGRDYHNQCMACPVKYCRITRRMFPSGWQYYLQLVLEGTPPAKGRVAGHGPVGIDLGTSTVAAVSETGCILEQLSPDTTRREGRIISIQQHMDACFRRANPDSYNPDGTIREGRQAWVYSGVYRKLQRQLKTAFRRGREARKSAHETLANQILALGDTVYVEKMSMSGLAKRAKASERQGTAVLILQKDSTEKMVCKYKRTRRFGSSIGVHAPSMLVGILNRKLGYAGSSVLEVDTMSYRASQYDHVSDTYQKKDLSTRSFLVGGQRVQRDLYSAFLLMNSVQDLTRADRKSCIKSFPSFMKHHDACIRRMIPTVKYRNPCFGLIDFAV